jgi:hypothetical protein
MWEPSETDLRWNPLLGHDRLLLVTKIVESSKQARAPPSLKLKRFDWTKKGDSWWIGKKMKKKMQMKEGNCIWLVNKSERKKMKCKRSKIRNQG